MEIMSLELLQLLYYYLALGTLIMQNHEVGGSKLPALESLFFAAVLICMTSRTPISTGFGCFRKFLYRTA